MMVWYDRCNASADTYPSSYAFVLPHLISNRAGNFVSMANEVVEKPGVTCTISGTTRATVPSAPPVLVLVVAVGGGGKLGVVVAIAFELDE